MNQIKTDFNELIKLYRSSDYGTIFDSLTINLPEYYKVLADQKKLNAIFSEMHEKLISAKVSFEGHEAYFYDQIIDLIKPVVQLPSDLFGITKYLRDTCKIEQKDINFTGVSDDSTLFPKLCLNHRIYLSRWGAYLLCNNLAIEFNSINNVFNADLFIPIGSSKTQKSEINDELRVLFAKYFFAMSADASTDEIETFVNRFVRSKWNCKVLNLAENELKHLYMHALVSPKDFDIRHFNVFVNKFIFDILFATTNSGSENFDEIYRKHLKDIGYVPRGKYAKMIKNCKAAPERPFGFFSAHMQFLFSKVVFDFLKFARNEMNGARDKMTILENSAKTYFNVIRKATQSPFIKSLFSSENTKEARGHITALKNGKHTVDKKTGEIFFDNDGALNIHKNESLFHKSYIPYFKDIKDLEIKINNLHKEWETQPTEKLAEEIIKAEKSALELRQIIYGCNFQGFSYSPLFLMPNGKLVKRPLFGANIIQKVFVIPKVYFPNDQDIEHETISSLAGQYKIDFDNPVGFEYKSILLKNAPLGEFKIMPDYQITDVKFGESITYNCYTNKDGILKKDWFLNPDGIFETVNPLIENPIAFRTKNGTQLPKLIKENFQMRNFVIESDVMSIEDQKILARKLIALGIANRVMESGNKSVHINISVKDMPNTPDEYTWLFFYICMKLGLVSRKWNKEKLKFEYSGSIDLSLSSNNSNTRKPNATRELEYTDANGNPAKKYSIQTLLHKTNTIYDINWRNAYEEENHWIKSQKLITTQKYDNSLPTGNVCDFIQFYAIKNNLSLDFPQGSGHHIGCVIIGAAKKRGFNGKEIKKALEKLDCGGRYKELVGGWMGLFK